MTYDLLPVDLLFLSFGSKCFSIATLPTPKNPSVPNGCQNNVMNISTITNTVHEQGVALFYFFSFCYCCAITVVPITHPLCYSPPRLCSTPTIILFVATEIMLGQNRTLMERGYVTAPGLIFFNSWCSQSISLYLSFH